MRAELLESLAKLALYPGDDYFNKIESALVFAPGSEPLRKFAALVAAESITHLQELYTKTFDLNPLCAPELGWHLFGETYERGAFLVRMRQELRNHNIPEGPELPDHLTYSLALTARMTAEEAEYFVVACFAPAVHKMLQSIPEENIFRPLLLAISESLEKTCLVVPNDVPMTLTVLNEGAME